MAEPASEKAEGQGIWVPLWIAAGLLVLIIAFIVLTLPRMPSKAELWSLGASFRTRLNVCFGSKPDIGELAGTTSDIAAWCFKADCPLTADC